MLRTNLWLVPGIEVLAAIATFAVTLTLDHAAYRGEFGLPSWVISGTADAARQILTAIAAAVITVVGVVFSIILVTLTLASTQFGPRMLRNFIRDRGTQLTLGTFVATFVYAVLVLVSIGPGSNGDFVPHIGVTVTLALMVADMGVLIYFIHHTATSIQLPQVIASIARDLSGAIEVQGGDDGRPGSERIGESGPSAAELRTRMEQDGGVVRAPASSSGTRSWCGSLPARTRSSPWTTGQGTSSSRGTRLPRSGRPRPRNASATRSGGRTSPGPTGRSRRTSPSASTSSSRSPSARCHPPSMTPSPR
jgi:hypothetical protein